MTNKHSLNIIKMAGLIAPLTFITLCFISAESAITGNGVNLQPSYYNGGNVQFGWDLMKQYGKIRSVRIEIEPDVNIETAKSWIRGAAANGLEILATYHKYTVLGSDDENELANGATWWAQNWANLASAGPFTINMMNEWGSHNISPGNVARAYNRAISILRSSGYQGTIVIDAPGWGQETAVLASAVKGQTDNGQKIDDQNIQLSVHVYPNGWNQALNHNLQASDLDDLASAGRPCIVGEFGADAAGGPVDWQGVVNKAKSLGWPVIGWSWNGDGGSMNMVQPTWGSNPNANSFSPSSYFDTIYSIL